MTSAPSPVLNRAAYLATADFSPADWLAAIDHRYWLRYMLAANDSPRLVREMLRHRAASLIEAPFEWKGNQFPRPSGIQDLEVYRAWCMRPALEHDPELVQAITNIEGAIAAAGSATVTQLGVLYSSFNTWAIRNKVQWPPYLKDDGRRVLTVDLGLTDEKLIEDFKHWIRAARETKCAAPEGAPHRGRKLSSKTMKRWHDNRALQFIDLKFWAEVHGQTISDQIAGDLIFPEAADGADASDVRDLIRKTVRPLAKQLMSLQLITALTGYAQQVPSVAGKKTHP